MPYLGALKVALSKLNPLYLWRNPVLLTVEAGALWATYEALFTPQGGPFPLLVAVILWLTVLLGTWAESLAEAQGKARAESLRRTRQETMAKKLTGKDREYRLVPASSLRKGDRVLVEAGDIIPGDGTVLEGIATVDESAITGESAPVLKEPGTDVASSVTAGTQVVSDWLIIQIDVNPGESYLDHMIRLVEGATRKPTPNEQALQVLLVALTLIFALVVLTLWPLARFLGATLDPIYGIALYVCLIPTTIAALLSAVGIAGMNRVAQFNVLALSGRAVEAAGDVDVLLLDKTGTITYGHRMAAQFIPVGGHSEMELIAAALRTSVADETPEGRSIVALAREKGVLPGEESPGTTFIPFAAETRMSGIDTPDGLRLRKGAADAVEAWVKAQGGTIPPDLQAAVEKVSLEGGTPLVVAQNQEILGVIYLKDTVKEGLKERFAELRKMGVRTIMCTGDNRLTAATIAREVGVDEYLAEVTPEAKMERIRKEQAAGHLVAMTGDGTNDAPALALADVGLAMQSGTQPAKEAANMVDLDSDPTKLLDVIAIGKQLLITRGALTTFSIANDVAKYFAILPALLAPGIPALEALNIMHLHSPQSAILSAVLFNALIIPALIPLALKGVRYRPAPAQALLVRNMALYGVGGVLLPFFGIKLLDLLVTAVGVVP